MKNLYRPAPSVDAGLEAQATTPAKSLLHDANGVSRDDATAYAAVIAAAPAPTSISDTLNLTGLAPDSTGSLSDRFRADLTAEGLRWRGPLAMGLPAVAETT